MFIIKSFLMTKVGPVFVSVGFFISAQPSDYTARDDVSGLPVSGCGSFKTEVVLNQSVTRM